MADYVGSKVALANLHIYDYSWDVKGEAKPEATILRTGISNVLLTNRGFYYKVAVYINQIKLELDTKYKTLTGLWSLLLYMELNRLNFNLLIDDALSKSSQSIKSNIQN